MGLTKLKQKLGFGNSKNKGNRGGTTNADAVQELPGAEADTSSVKKSSRNDPAVDTQESPSQTRDGPTDQIDKSDPLEKQSPNSKDNIVPIRDLWNLAYERLREEDERLISDYESKIQESLSAGLSSTMGSKISMRERMDIILRRKMDEINRDTWKLRFGSSEVQVKDLAQPVLGVVNWANDYVTSALSTNPYASIAWAGVSLILPLFLHPSEQGASLAKGLEYISSLIAQSYMREDLYIRRYEAKASDEELPLLSHAAYQNALEMLYRDILRFQATSYGYYAKNAAFRLTSDVVKWDDWNELLGQIQEQERRFAAVEALWRDLKYDEESSAAERRHQETLHQWSGIGADLSGLRSAVESAQAEKSRWYLLNWLCDVDPSEMYNAARDKHGAGTGDWLTKESEEFKAWETSSSSLLWLHGKAGSGKSILSSVVIKHLQDHYASDPSTALAYFFFSFSDLEKQKVTQMLASLIKQLCSRRPDTPQLIKSLSEYMEKSQRPDTQTLEAMLIAAARGFTAVHIVIDALDECPTLQGERKKLLSSLRRIMTAAPANLHVLCTSRKEADIDAVLSALLSPSETAAAIDLTARREILDRDIGLFIDLTLASEEYSSWPKDIKEEARNSLIEKADGMFQYVYSQLEALQKLSSAPLIRKALQDLPVGLDATYDRLLLSLDLTFRTQIISCLKWLAFSNEVLLLEQLAEIFILYPQRAVPFDETERLFHFEDVVKYLSSLIVVENHFESYTGTSDSGGYYVAHVRLAHFSVKEYLISPRISEGPAMAFSFGEVDAHLHIAHCCLAYHLQYSTTAEYDSYLLKLMSYAVINWLSHLEMVPRASWPAEITQAVARALAIHSQSLQRLLNDSSDFLDHPGYRYEYTSNMLLRPQCYTARLGFFQLTEMLLSPENGINAYLTQEDLNMALHDAAYGGRMAVVQFCLSKGAELNSKSEFFGDALQAAAYKGHAAVVSFLLDSGADINAQRGEWGSALQAAASGTQFDVLQLLVSRGADINLPSNDSGCVLTSTMSRIYWEYSSLECLRYLLDAGADINKSGGDVEGAALHKAAAHLRSTRALFRLLLERGANVNEFGGEYGYPLQAACRNAESYEEVELLLDRGADVNAKGGKYGYALQAACQHEDAWKLHSSGSKSTIKLLIARGADINAEGGEFGTALQAACATFDSQAMVMKLLLEEGADASIQGGKYGNALVAACRYGNLNMVELLLGSGADVNTATGGKYGNPLHAAAMGDSGGTEVLTLLLDHGAEVNARGGKFGTALQAACTSGEMKRVRVLLDRGADVNIEGGEYGTALQAACATNMIGIMGKDKLSMLELLLEHGADVHTQGGHFGSAWHAAAAQVGEESTDVLQLLLDHGVDINDARGKQNPTALDAAFGYSYDAGHKVHFLLDHGADPSLAAGIYGFLLQSKHAREFSDYRIPFLLENCTDLDSNQQGGVFEPALREAAWTGQADLVKILVRKGADVNARGGEYGSALNAAVIKGYWDIVEVLLDGGATPDCHLFQEADEAWLLRVEEEWGRGAVARYWAFWEKQKKQHGKESS